MPVSRAANSETTGPKALNKMEIKPRILQKTIPVKTLFLNPKGPAFDSTLVQKVSWQQARRKKRSLKARCQANFQNGAPTSFKNI